jgi:hypothetical protein
MRIDSFRLLLEEPMNFVASIVEFSVTIDTSIIFGNNVHNTPERRFIQENRNSSKQTRENILSVNIHPQAAGLERNATV